MLNATARLLGDPTNWINVSVSYDDRHGLWGGQAIQIDGRGQLTLELQRVPQHTQIAQIHLTEQEVRAVFQLLIDQDFLTVSLPAVSGPILPDTSSATIVLRAADQQSHTITQYVHGPDHPRFQTVREALLALGKQAESTLRHAAT
jgi:hypothetical protein